MDLPEDEDEEVTFTDEEIENYELTVPDIIESKGQQVKRYKPKNLMRSGTSSDCRFRKENRCTKTNKVISIDWRSKEQKCWERMWCDDYEKETK